MQIEFQKVTIKIQSEGRWREQFGFLFNWISYLMIDILIAVVMSQTKLQVKLPLQLTLQHFCEPSALEIDQSYPLQESEDAARIEAKLKAMVPFEKMVYPHPFVVNFLLIKLNSWLTYSSLQSTHFITCLAKYFNKILTYTSSAFKYSRNDSQLMAQILLESRAFIYMKSSDLEEIIEGSALVASTAIEAYKSVKPFLEKCYYSTVLGISSLHGRTNPYISIVHVEKNHPGQIEFAKRMDELIHFSPKVQKVNLDIIQDPYSLRCTPQVHGVLHQCLQSLFQSIDGLLRKPQTKHIAINGRRVRNLALRSVTQTLILDNLIFSLNEIGHMSFLRSQRILNKYLSPNGMQKNQHYEYLMILLNKSSYLVCENKLLAVPSNADTTLVHNYTRDIYTNEGSAFRRFQIMLENIKRIFKVEIMAAVEAIYSIYHKEEELYLHKEMEKAYLNFVEMRSEDSLAFGGKLEQWLEI